MNIEFNTLLAGCFLTCIALAVLAVLLAMIVVRQLATQANHRGVRATELPTTTVIRVPSVPGQWHLFRIFLVQWCCHFLLCLVISLLSDEVLNSIKPIVAVELGALLCFILAAWTHTRVNSTRAGKYLWLFVGTSTVWINTLLNLRITNSRVLVLMSLAVSLILLVASQCAVLFARDRLAKQLQHRDSPTMCLQKKYTYLAKWTASILISVVIYLAFFTAAGPLVFGLVGVNAPWLVIFYLSSQLLPLVVQIILSSRFVIFGLMESWPILYLRSFGYDPAAQAIRKFLGKELKLAGVVLALTHETQPSRAFNKNISEEDRFRLFLAAEDSWRAWVQNALNSAGAVVIDLSTPSSSLAWEFSEAIKRVSLNRILVIYDATAGKSFSRPPFVTHDIEAIGYDLSDPQTSTKILRSRLCRIHGTSYR